MSLSVGYITSRFQPRFDWFFDSLAKQDGIKFVTEIIVVDYFCVPNLKNTTAAYPSFDRRRNEIMQAAEQARLSHVLKWIAPKPNIWGGNHMVCQTPHWHAAVSRNTAFASCKNEFIAMLDDRCVILPGWIKAIQTAAKGKYAICGAYQKRTGITVNRGTIVHSGIVTGEDGRENFCITNNKTMPFKCGGEWMYGCNFSLPIEWALQVNGQDELSCGLGMDDVFFGLHLGNNGYDIRFDSGMKIIEDRSADASGPIMRRDNKKKNGNVKEDKDHTLLAKMRPLKTSNIGMDLRQIRKDVLNAKPWPVPATIPPPVDWYDGTPISEFK